MGDLTLIVCSVFHGQHDIAKYINYFYDSKKQLIISFIFFRFIKKESFDVTLPSRFTLLIILYFQLVNTQLTITFEIYLYVARLNNFISL